MSGSHKGSSGNGIGDDGLQLVQMLYLPMRCPVLRLRCPVLKKCMAAPAGSVYGGHVPGMAGVGRGPLSSYAVAAKCPVLTCGCCAARAVRERLGCYQKHVSICDVWSTSTLRGIRSESEEQPHWPVSAYTRVCIART
eukprot:982747-Rhodomonas_salina.3